MGFETSSTSPTSQLTPEQVVHEVRHLPSAPKVLPKLKRLLRDANSSMEEIVKVIRIEPGIAARVIQVSNSTFHCKGGQRCGTVEEAVNRVGYSQVYDLVSHAVASQVLVRPLATYGLESDELWRSSVLAGLASEFLAEGAGMDRDEAYTAGLLHCVGMVAIDTWAQRHAATLRLKLSPYPQEYLEAERAALGFTHADVGAVLLALWEFPPEMNNAIHWQDSPRSALSSENEAALLYAAKWIRTVVLADERQPPPGVDEAAIRPLKQSAKTLGKLAAKVRAQSDGVKRLLEIGSSPVKAPNAR